MFDPSVLLSLLAFGLFADAPEEWEAVFLRLLKNPNERLAIRKASREQAIRRFLYEVIAKQYADVLSPAFEDNPSHPAKYRIVSARCIHRFVQNSTSSRHPPMKRNMQKPFTTRTGSSIVYLAGLWGFSKTCSPRLSREETLRIKGLAVLIMVTFHLFGWCFSIARIRLFAGASCVALFAFLSGYAHTLSLARNGTKCPFYIGASLFFRFYRKYLVCFVLCLLPFLYCGKKPGLMPLVAFPVWPNLASDSWWYAAFFAFLCFVALPALGLLLRTCREMQFVATISAIAMSCIAAPAFFANIECLPGALKDIWGPPPILRGIAFFPYYILGVLAFSLTNGHGGAAKIGLAVCLAALVLYPFGLGYPKIRGIVHLDVSCSFLISLYVVALAGQFQKAAAILEKAGKHSTWIWLLHMPIFSVVNKWALGHHGGGVLMNRIVIPASAIAITSAVAVLLEQKFGNPQKR